ncbi:hypothetical protein GUITHDRAFT_85883 [Guillardia theta CCMP2712]|uniref:WASH complex subunit strumpellin n=1 Tax=Guillardia theta (strain CCMP2712) TaxID=905079 RepID=L1JLR9_GUITC|nr:hypothetical protein GUITHDRAFT_85883 [Guillardia theta CCMP2712]EKX49139.1 hypothetical protein GUITHDRAFT_85883 [Guillardia theta CCMP2712]|mmetsp:Transcript_16183/g.54210  ORF Transcript_16183/g.54210 Transcript_16183/m.54210 type:complete len:1143 (-) Transcript_16183:7-3435(-)|eukprot:XP_005836119.1 hypothetical protein GUITHDRAFT_85883 [Guillardia theta CCMP2712]
MDFLSADNLAGQNLLSIVSRGSAIIAELLRLSDNIPSVFYLADKADQAKYGPLLHDFSYLRNMELYENRISSDPLLIDLDEEFRESHMQLLERFFKLFESVYKYVKDLTRYLEDVEEGVYIQHRIEDILASDSGKQLLAEAYYLYGLMLTLMDNRIEGPVRERMLICYYRYKGSSDSHSAVCNIFRSSGYLPSSQKRPPRYPEDFFARLAPPIPVARMVINRLRSDDIYSQMKEWPNPEHRCTALATQAAILYIILFFVPDILHKEFATMREIVDKHFSDNWVISFYMGFVVDLSVMWEPYKAASSALKNTTETKLVKEIHRTQLERVEEQLKQLSEYLTEGILVEEFILDQGHKILNCLRNSNAAIRWTMLHRNCKNKKLRDVISAGPNPEKILLLLMRTAQLEFKVGDLYKALLEGKETRWKKAKEECEDRLRELSHFFSGDQMLTRATKDEKLKDWFASLAAEVSSLDHQDSTLAGRKMQQLAAALEDVEQFHQIETNSHVKHFLADARSFLKQMVRIVNVKEQMLITLASIGDLSYAFDIISDYVHLMHQQIKRDPFSVLLLRATFLKLASVLELPLIRINQAGSEDLTSVAEYYSSQLVAFVRRVLEVIPVNVFLILNEIISVQTSSMKQIPSRLERAQLKEYAQMEERYKLARSTHQVSVFTEGILAMEKTLMGIVEVDPKQLLQEGIRKELVRQISMALHGILIFSSGKVEEFEMRLEELRRNLDGFRLSFEYISDYINLYGLKIWQEEFTRIIDFNVEQECNVFLKKKTYPWDSRFQSTAIPIPLFAPVDEHSVSFVGRLLREILLQTDSHKSLFLTSHSGWFDMSGREIFGIRTCAILHRSLGTAGIRGLDKTISFMIVRDLNDVMRFYRRQVLEGLKVLLPELQSELNPTTTLPAMAARIYSNALARTSRLWPWLSDVLARIGQAQLLRRQFAAELNFVGKLDSATLSGALEVMNQALLSDIAMHYKQPETHAYPSEEKQLLPQLAPFLDALGLSSPMLKIYVTTEPLEGIACFIALFVISLAPILSYNKKLGTLQVKDRNLTLDGSTIIVGVATFLRQFHSSNTHKFIAYLAQYVRCQVIITSKDAKLQELPGEVASILIFLDEFCRYGEISRSLVRQHLPPYVFDKFPVQ